EGNRSRSVEMDPTTGEIVWEYASSTPNSFYTAYQGSTQRLPNGNTLIVSTGPGHVFEVTEDKEVVWEFINPFAPAGRKCYFEDATRNFIHRAHRYGPDYPGLAGRDLSRKGLIDAGCPQEWQAWVEPTVEAPTVAVTGGTFSPGQQLQITVTCAGPGPYDILAGAQVGNTKYYIQNNQFLEAGLRAPALRNHTPDGAPITVLDMTVLPGWGEFSVDIFAEVSNPGAIQSIADATGSLAISAGTDGGGVDDGGGDDGGGDDGGGGDGGGY
ncbi:MAG: hypothetical protein JRG73_12600, partial [Deltaproteobacteria bacterium]|nr:hypothetical protein [Deltaproteobacteria bacterium]